MMSKTKLLVLMLFVILTLFSGCNTSGREYKEDLIVELSTDEKLIIKEWCFLLGSGAEIYYQRENQKSVFLGRTSGGDDGACPFSLGQYEIACDGNAVTIKWRFDTDTWHSETFELPS